MMRLGYAYIDRDDPNAAYIEVRMRWPLSFKQRRRNRAWRKYARTLPSGTNLVQITDASAFTLTRSVRRNGADS